MKLFSTAPFEWLLNKYGLPLYTGVVRFVRTLLWAAAVSATAYGLEHVSDLNVGGAEKLLALSVLLGLDKYFRERQAEDADV